MTRIEPTPPIAPHAAPRFRLPIPRFSLGRLLKLAILVGIFWVLVQVARTGVWTIPFISALAYTPPTPVRVVYAAEPSTGNLLTRVPAALTAGTVTITEAELSALAEAGNQKLHLGLANVQTAVVNNGIELSFLMPQRNNAVVRLDMVPGVNEDGDPDFTVQRTRLGTLDVPQWVVGEPARRLLQLQLQPVFKLLPAVGGVQAVEGALAYSVHAT